MLKIIVPFLLLTSVVGCSSMPEQNNDLVNPCTTKWGSSVENNRVVNSYKRTECTDDLTEIRMRRFEGVKGMCKPYKRTITRSNGSTFVIQGDQCRDKITGDWVVVNP